MNRHGVACAMPLVVAGACFAPTYSDVRCDLNRVCPDGLTCDVDGVCRDEPLAPDAQTADGSPLDTPADAFTRDAPTQCPIDYVNGYRHIATMQTWRAAEADCEDDSAGLTHLLVIDDPSELAAINTAIAADVWIGVVRNPAPDRSTWRWRAVTGGLATFIPWEVDQPDNASSNQLVVALIDASGAARDVDISSSRAALCECDGLPPIDADYLDP